MNNSLNANTQFEFVVRGKRPRLHRVGWEEAEAPVADAPAAGTPRDPERRLSVSWHLAPGQMELFRCENVTGW